MLNYRSHLKPEWVVDGSSSSTMLESCVENEYIWDPAYRITGTHWWVVDMGSAYLITSVVFHTSKCKYCGFPFLQNLNTLDFVNLR